MIFDKKIIAKNFSRAAKTYNQAASIQNLAAEELCNIALPFIKKNIKILDIGSGTSFIAKNFNRQKILTENNIKFYEIDLSLEMLKNWPEKPENILPIQGDAGSICFKPNSFDILISSFSLQWLQDLDKIFTSFYKILKPNGVFIFCLPVNESLKELREASLKSECKFRFNSLPIIEDLNFLLKESNFKINNSFTKNLTEEFENSIDALKSLKKVGANSFLTKINPITKTQLRKFENFCLKNSTMNGKKFSNSWKVAYFVLNANS